MYQERIKKIRSELKLSVAKMADEMNIPSRTFVSYESDGRTPSLEFLAQLCKTFDINANWFITGKGNMFNEQQPYANNEELEQKVVEVMKKYGVIEK